MRGLMACFSGINSKGKSSAVSNNKSSVRGDRGVTLHTISVDWTNEENAILHEALVNFASVSNNILRYAKISAQLKGKTIRDVALRCKWMSMKETSKSRKEGINQRITKDKKT